VQLPSSMLIDLQMARARGSLAVPLKIFTMSLFSLPQRTTSQSNEKRPRLYQHDKAAQREIQIGRVTEQGSIVGTCVGFNPE
jgi:hypothetical protein